MTKTPKKFIGSKKASKPQSEKSMQAQTLRSNPLFTFLVNRFRVEAIIDGVCFYFCYQNKYEKKAKKILSITFPLASFLEHVAQDNKEGSFSQSVEQIRGNENETERLTAEELEEAEEIHDYFANIGSFSVNKTFGGEFWAGIVSPMQLLALQHTKQAGKKMPNLSATIDNVISFPMLNNVIVALWDDVQLLVRELEV